MVSKEEAHNSGQTHRREGKSEREPYGVLDRLTSSRSEEARKEGVNRAYRDGYKNTSNQKK